MWLFARKVLGNITFVSGNSIRRFNAVNTKPSHWKRLIPGSIHLPISHNNFTTHLILSSHLLLCLPSSRFHKNFIIETFLLFLVSNILATCLVHPSIPNFTIVAALGDTYKSQNSSLCNILKRPCNSDLLWSRVIIFVFPKKRRNAKVIQNN
jgi:hypothetical protein